MRAFDIANHIAQYLPRLVDDFTDNVSVTSLTRSGTTATVTTSSAHGLTIGQQVNITGAQTPIVISSLTRVGVVGTLVTAEDHDATENAGFDVQIEGATEAEFNGTFTLLSVPNRRTITFQMPDSGATVATGSPVITNVSNIFQSYNGLVEVTAVPSATSFEYQLSNSSIFSPASGTIIAKTGPKITAFVNFESMLNAYTEQSNGKSWLGVVVGDAVANKSRRVDTDATDDIQNGNYFNQRLIQNVAVYVAFNSKNEIAGRAARDRAAELLSPICQTVLGFKFPSLVENTNNPLMITGHGVQFFQGAYYVHEYTFEATIQLGPSDIFKPEEDVAFRDIDLTMGLSTGNETFDSEIDLDDQPL